MEQLHVERAISNLIREGILPDNCEYKRLPGGTQSNVGMITYEGQPKYVLKAGKPKVLAAEVKYLQTYQHISLLPVLHYVDSDSRFIVYEYVSGETKYSGQNKKSLLYLLTQNIISQYRKVPAADKWGFLHAPQSSWRSFLTQVIVEERSTIGENLSDEDYTFIFEIANRKSSNTPYLLHGDFGVHNFLFENEKLRGVIDPFPVIGEPIYDLVYAFCSTPDTLDLDTLEPAVSLLSNWNPENKTSLHQEVLLGLYFRIAKCIRWHPTDLPQYLASWHRWKSDLNHKMMEV